MTIYKDTPKTSYQTTVSRLSILMHLYRGILILGVIISLFAFPLDMFKQIRIGDAIIPLITFLCAVKLYGNGKLKAGYTKGYKEAVTLKENYSLLNVGLDGIKPSTSTL